MVGGGREGGEAIGRWDFYTFRCVGGGEMWRVDRKEGAGGNGEGAFHRWNAWVDILFPRNAGSPS